MHDKLLKQEALPDPQNIAPINFLDHSALVDRA